MNSLFSEEILSDKLSKLNNTQQCIETLSHWCIFHRSKAELVVTTWEKQFHKSEMDQKVPLLYLANDILQNSKRKGNEFVLKFWKVLPGALKDVSQNGDDRGKNVVSRLVDIWEQRRVFGSRAQSLKDLMLGEKGLPVLELNKKRPRSVRIIKRDSRSIRTKLSIGSVPERIVSAFHLVLSDHPNEDSEMTNCKTSVQRVRKLEKEFETTCSTANDPKRKPLAKELEDEENTLIQCIGKLKSVETTRAALVSQLKDALHEQESQLENLRTQIQVAQTQAEEAESMKKRLEDEDYVFRPSTSNSHSNESNGQMPKRSAASIAAEVADKLAASTSSQLIMSSVLSSIAAEEAKSAGLSRSSNSFPDPGSKSDNHTVSSSGQFMPAPSAHPSYHTVVGPMQQTLQTQPIQTSAAQPQYHHILPNQPGPAHQYLQPAGGAIVGPYGFGNFHTMPAPHAPPPTHLLGSVVPVARPPPPPTQQHPVPPNFQPLQPPGLRGLYSSTLNPSK